MAYVYTMGSTSQPRIDITGIQNTIAARAATVTAMLQNPSLAGGQRTKLQGELKVLQDKLGELGAKGAQVDALEVQKELPTMIRMAAKQLSQATPTPTPASAPVPVVAAQPAGGAASGYFPAASGSAPSESYEDEGEYYEEAPVEGAAGALELYKNPMVWGPLAALAGVGVLFFIMRR